MKNDFIKVLFEYYQKNISIDSVAEIYYKEYGYPHSDKELFGNIEDSLKEFIKSSIETSGISYEVIGDFIAKMIFKKDIMVRGITRYLNTYGLLD